MIGQQATPEGDRGRFQVTTVQHATAAQGGDRSSTYAYPAAGSARAHAVTSVMNKNAAGAVTGISEFDYDDSGNMTGRSLAGQVTQTLGWDAEGELAQVAQDGNADGDTADANETDTYLYGADGDRLIRTQDGAATLYLPGGMELTAYADGRANTALRYYTFNGKTIATRSAAGATNQVTIVPDHHGTPALQVAQATNKVTRQYTDPFGATRGALTGDADANGRLDGTTPVWKGDHGYLDKPEDTTGLTAIGARMYDPTLGRFITVDPIMDLTDPQQWNAYAYSNNNPLSWSDPTGKLPSFNAIDGDYQLTIKVNKKATGKKADPRGSTVDGDYDVTNETNWKTTGDRTVRPVRQKTKYVGWDAEAARQAYLHPQDYNQVGSWEEAHCYGNSGRSPAGCADWYRENKKPIANGVMFVAGGVGMGVCIVVSVGTCAIVSVGIIGAGYYNNTEIQGMNEREAKAQAGLQIVTLGWGSAVGWGLRSASTSEQLIGGAATNLPGAICMGTSFANDDFGSSC